MAPRRPADARNLVMSSGRRIPRPEPAKPDLGRRPDPAPRLDGAEQHALDKAGAELQALARVVADCTACGRAEAARVHGSGYPRAPIMLLKDAPGEADAASGVAFAEEAPALQRAFEGLRIPFSWVYGTTAVRCGTATPGGDELKACASHLLVEIEAVAPRVVVAFGGRAMEALRVLDGRCGLRVPEEVERGEPVTLRYGLVVVLTEPLPAGVTNPEAKKRLWRDLQQVPGLL
jgi:uracil-DNA glycosylase family 4